MTIARVYSDYEIMFSINIYNETKPLHRIKSEQRTAIIMLSVVLKLSQPLIEVTFSKKVNVSSLLHKKFQANKLGYMDKTNVVWLLNDQANSLAKLDNNLTFGIGSNIFTYQTITSDVIALKEVYQIHPRNNVIVRNIGLWNTEIGLTLTKHPKWSRRGNFQGLKITCTTEEAKIT